MPGGERILTPLLSICHFGTLVNKVVWMLLGGWTVEIILYNFLKWKMWHDITLFTTHCSPTTVK